MNYAVLSVQAAAFGASLIYGAALCVLYDIMRLLHRRGVRSPVAVFLLDILFWAAAAAATFCLALLYAGCHIRFYLIAGEFIGFVIFRLLFSDIFLKIAEWIINAAAFVAAIILKPIKALAKAVYGAVLSAFRSAAALFNRLFLSVMKKIKKSRIFSAKNA